MSSTVSIQEITARKIVPVVVVNSVESAKALGHALVDGGLPVAEVTFRTQAAPEAIELLANRGDLIVGAGTVLNVEQVKQAYERGATFIVSPGFDRAVVEKSLELGLSVLPGTVTPSEIMAAKSLGLNHLKFFPANVYGGVKAIKALSAPFGGMNFIPTGGVNVDNLCDYLSLSCIPAVGGSWMVPAKLADAGKTDQLTELIAEAVKAASNC
ncbi:bifunctional 4-hydroxy-2-oxoglutarate aldolase/2-dehydro-3-deoxy-phosphogluconate aldolase [Actinomycetaceae bacterium TAE3-ERU4]|nr:bifunctional 4-hydroxy-2-oxoglutarate aldolase/2-dehydro-3-deoxy-phosphogluconate aldolase [Actinomycetaceae bacterium TAE3-ERU4]